MTEKIPQLKNMGKYNSLVLRTGIATVLLWFGFSQLKNPASWTRMIPEYMQSLTSLSPTTLVYMNGALEIILAVLILLGLFTRLASFLVTIHMIHITTIVGYGATGARDFAIALASLSMFLRGPDSFCLDHILRKEKVEDKK